MSGYNDGSTFDRDDAALVDESAPTTAAGGDSDAVSAPQRGVGDTTVGSVDAAEAEFEASGGTAQATDAETAAPADEAGPSEPEDRFDDESASSGPQLTFGSDARQPNTQGDDPIYAELGDEGQGDLSPEDQM